MRTSASAAFHPRQEWDPEGALPSTAFCHIPAVAFRLTWTPGGLGISPRETARRTTGPEWQPRTDPITQYTHIVLITRMNHEELTAMIKQVRGSGWTAVAGGAIALLVAASC